MSSLQIKPVTLAYLVREYLCSVQPDDFGEWLSTEMSGEDCLTMLRLPKGTAEFLKRGEEAICKSCASCAKELAAANKPCQDTLYQEGDFVRAFIGSLITQGLTFITMQNVAKQEAKGGDLKL